MADEKNTDTDQDIEKTSQVSLVANRKLDYSLWLCYVLSHEDARPSSSSYASAMHRGLSTSQSRVSTFFWIPCHDDNQGNELAYITAKTMYGTATAETPLEQTDCSPAFKGLLSACWQWTWNEYHKDTSVHHLHVAILSIGDHDRNLENQTNENNNTGNDEEPCTEICHSDEDENNFLSDREIESALTTTLATFLLSIQTKHHVPEIIHWYEHDNLKAVHDTLRSKSYRKKYYKEKFDYVEPLPHPEPKHKKDDTKALCYYVPLKDSLQALFRDEKISHYFEKSENNGDSGVLTDFTDGKVCNENVFFQENPDALKLLLYQDSFEIVNPLGSAKKKHKILAIYYTIGNLHPAVRTLIDVQQLLLLCREEDFKTHGSHMIGGFVENFSSVSHNCRYCLISKDDLEGGNIFPWDFDLMTQENYNSSVQEVCTNGLVHHSGVKFDSVLNKLQHFHVTNPGLPPCLGHDLCEGIVKEDLHLILNYLVRAEWFDYDYLNKKIQTYKFKGSDANDKPPFTLSSKTVSGHAVQVWVLLRFLPLLIHGKIDDHNNEVWQLLLLLRQIVELICAPVISEYQVAIMLDLIEEYIVKRMKLFPNINLRAKHHFLTHYPELTLKCGPLIRLWTFEIRVFTLKSMPSVSEEVKNFLVAALHLPADKMVALEKLQEFGMENLEDLEFLDPEKDLEGTLNLLACRKLALKLKAHFTANGIL
ncbi:uncharacterized protein LOC143232592 [Tachypleus tridentatus]|uniref:uncharacterized protein LOC143232592 n=1 Tax=Tachypleus tridentatus TaxID=6853 RepID=UPI003FD58F55